MVFSNLFLWFFCYSFWGWFYESTLCSLVGESRFFNRGFLLGPYCPIYGVGALICWLALDGCDSVYVIFFVSALLCCALEYVTSFGMEKLFHARWWDYSNLPFQLHGRVCLYGGIIFGTANVLLHFFLHPALMWATGAIDTGLLNGAAFGLSVAMAVDLFLTLGSWKSLNRQLKTIHDAISAGADGTFSRLTDRFFEVCSYSVIEKGRGLLIRTQRLDIWLKHSELRFLQAFPSLHIPPYEAMIRKLGLKERVRKDSSGEEAAQKPPEELSPKENPDILPEMVKGSGADCSRRTESRVTA